jgi:hypothetical protein
MSGRQTTTATAEAQGEPDGLPGFGKPDVVADADADAVQCGIIRPIDDVLKQAESKPRETDHDDTDTPDAA